MDKNFIASELVQAAREVIAGKIGYYKLDRELKLVVSAQRATWRKTLKPGYYHVDRLGFLSIVDAQDNKKKVSTPTGDTWLSVNAGNLGEKFLSAAKKVGDPFSSFALHVSVTWTDGSNWDANLLIDFIYEELEMSRKFNASPMIKVSREKTKGLNTEFYVSVSGLGLNVRSAISATKKIIEKEALDLGAETVKFG
jgi:hypothetical protein